MNKIQRTILGAVIVVIIAMFLYPPFTIHRGAGVYFNYGYHFILDPPEWGPSMAACVNVALLLTQMAGSMIIGAISYFMAKGKQL